jgi:hypothetical protein
MNRTELCRDFDRYVYNDLMSVEEANKKVREGGRLHDFLDSASKLFVLHRMQSRFGVALLHNHNLCNEGELMIQYTTTVNQENALVTRPVKTRAYLNDEVPSVWALSGRQFLPLEFTTDQKAREHFFAADVPFTFLNAYINLVESSSVGYLLGLAIVDRKFYETARTEDVAIEYSNSTERSNVIFLRNRDCIPQSIETTWIFESYTDMASGEALASTECSSTCKTGTKCNTRCIVDYGKHSEIHFEDSIHTQHHIQRPA